MTHTPTANHTIGSFLISAHQSKCPPVKFSSIVYAVSVIESSFHLFPNHLPHGGEFMLSCTHLCSSRCVVYYGMVPGEGFTLSAPVCM